MKSIVVEVLGTFLLAFVALTTGNYLAIGATLALAIFLGKGSYNPAVALAKYLRNDISSMSIIGIILAQLCGGGLAYLVSLNY